MAEEEIPRAFRLYDAIATAALDLGIDEEGIHIGEFKGNVEVLIEHDGRSGTIPVDRKRAGRANDTQLEEAETTMRTVAVLLGVPLPPEPEPS
jgi:hypothetical protein